MNKVTLLCSGSIEGEPTQQTSVVDKKIVVINPWYGNLSDYRTLKDPQDIVRNQHIRVAVRKSVNSPKEIWLEIYRIEPEVGKQTRVLYSAGEAVKTGLGFKLGVEVGSYSVEVRCNEIDPAP